MGVIICGSDGGVGSCLDGDGIFGGCSDCGCS